jgi:hypothetical protein
MSGAELITRLARLHARDRAWLLGELPSAMREELLTLLGEEPRAATPAPAVKPAGSWEALDAQRLAALLEAEPAWLVSAATRGSEPRWRERLLHAMGSRRRHEIELADRSGGSLGARAVSCLLEGCRERLASGESFAREGAPKQGFAALVEQMKERFS